MIRRQHIVRNFFADAELLRSGLDDRLRDPFSHKVDWRYFCVPKTYTYLSAEPERVFPRSSFEGFLQCLREWCVQNLGLIPMSRPGLHLMVSGCKLELHSDFHN